MNAQRLSPLPVRTFSGVTVREKTDAEALAESIERYAVEGQIALWQVVELLPLLKPHHWAAYARDAGIPHPAPVTILDAVERFKQRIGYVDPVAAPPAHDPTAATLPAFESSR